MEAEKIILSNGKTASRLATPTLTPTSDQSAKQISVAIKKAVVFFIGGAADKASYYFSGPFHNIIDAQRPLDQRIEKAEKGKRYQSHHVGYNEAKGEGDIQKYIISNIPNKECPVYIIGHSLGGWNGAHLSTILNGKGFKVKMLVTLDPVGEGAFVWLGSNIYYSKPEPKVEFWVNIRATPATPNQSDSVADFGEQWNVATGPNINYKINVNHADAGTMFLSVILNGKSAADFVYESILEHIEN